MVERWRKTAFISCMLRCAGGGRWCAAAGSVARGQLLALGGGRAGERRRLVHGGARERRRVARARVRHEPAPQRVPRHRAFPPSHAPTACWRSGARGSVGVALTIAGGVDVELIEHGYLRLWSSAVVRCRSRLLTYQSCAAFLRG